MGVDSLHVMRRQQGGAPLAQPAGRPSARCSGHSPPPRTAPSSRPTCPGRTGAGAFQRKLTDTRTLPGLDALPRRKEKKGAPKALLGLDALVPLAAVPAVAPMVPEPSLFSSWPSLLSGMAHVAVIAAFVIVTTHSTDMARRRNGHPSPLNWCTTCFPLRRSRMPLLRRRRPRRTRLRARRCRWRISGPSRAGSRASAPAPQLRPESPRRSHRLLPLLNPPPRHP